MIVDGVEVKTVPGFLDYAISRDGRVWSRPRRRLFSINNPEKFRFYPGRWLVPCRDSDGYLGITLCKGLIKYSRKIHRLVLETYVGPKLREQECRHLNGIKIDNELKNLRWGSPSENQLDRNKHGTGSQGELNPSVKLTEQDVRLIFNAYHDGAYSQVELAEMFSISQGTINCIVHKRLWKHLWPVVV